MVKCVKYVCQASDLVKVSKNSKKYATEWKGSEAKLTIKVKIQSLYKRFGAYKIW